MILYPDPKKGTLTATVTNFDWGIQMMSKYDYHIIEVCRMPLYKFLKSARLEKMLVIPQHLKTVSISRSSASSCAFSRHRGMCLTTKLKVCSNMNTWKKQGQGIWQCHNVLSRMKPSNRGYHNSSLQTINRVSTLPGPYLILGAGTLFKKLTGRGPTYSRVAQ